MWIYVCFLLFDRRKSANELQVLANAFLTGTLSFVWLLSESGLCYLLQMLETLRENLLLFFL